MAYGNEDCGYSQPAEPIIYPKNQELNYYLIRTTSTDEWEIAHGIYIVYAKNKRLAIDILRKKTDAKIHDIKRFKFKKEGILFIQPSIIE